MKILITGSTGYIGSHTCVELAKAGFDLVGVDNLSNSDVIVHDRVQTLVGRKFPFYAVDIRDNDKMRAIFKKHAFAAVIHFAGLKSVSESLSNPFLYYDNNVQGSLALMGCMIEYGVRRMVFSSSATVYGEPDSVPVKEVAPLRTTNPYGASKLMVENILRDHSNSTLNSNAQWSVSILRYFNPVGAHESGLIGEDPNGIPNNLMPLISQVAMGRRKKLSVFGGDYPTSDGTGVRDYIHVVDLALGHVCALKRLLRLNETIEVNLGTGTGSSVLDVIKTFEAASGCSIPYEIVERRIGDAATCYADPSLANELLAWKAKYSLWDMCASTWKWQTKNPSGYQ